MAGALAVGTGVLPLGPTGPDDEAPSAVVSSPEPSGSASRSASPTPEAPRSATVTIGYAGDVLMHMPVMADTPGGGGDISGLIAGAAPWFSGVDLALCGMEVPIAPNGIATGYPAFGTLPAVVTALGSTGWDGCATASNHAWDRGFDGVVATADSLASQGMGWAGTNRTEAESRRPYQLYELERDGIIITVAQLSTTYSLNGFVDTTGWAVNLNDVDWVTHQARAARKAGADIVVLHSQLGEEYLTEPVAAQRDYARAIAATGEVDLLFGAHPHVPQTNELVPGGPGGRGMWVQYSAGNFISNQSIAQGTVLAGIGLFVWADVTVTADPDGSRTTSVDALHWHPFTVDNAGGHRVLDLTALHEGRVPAGTTLSPAEIATRWEAVSAVVDPATYEADAPEPTGPEPTVLPR